MAQKISDCFHLHITFDFLLTVTVQSGRIKHWCTSYLTSDCISMRERSYRFRYLCSPSLRDERGEDKGQWPTSFLFPKSQDLAHSQCFYNLISSPDSTELVPVAEVKIGSFFLNKHKKLCLFVCLFMEKTFLQILSQNVDDTWINTASENFQIIFTRLFPFIWNFPHTQTIYWTVKSLLEIPP